MAGFENDVMVAKNVNFDEAAAKPHLGIINAAGKLPIGTGNTYPTPEILAGVLTSPDSSVTIGYSSPNITLVVAGGTTTGQTITGDSGGPLSPTAGNWNIFGQQALTTPVMDTIGSGSTLNIENRTWETQYIVDQSTTQGLRGTFSTIQAAIDQANADGFGATGAEVIIRPGTYNENILVAAGQSLTFRGTTGNAFPFSVTINGNLDFSSSILENINLEGTINCSGSLNLFNCRVFTATITLPGFPGFNAFNCLLTGCTLTAVGRGGYVLNNCNCGFSTFSSNGTSSIIESQNFTLNVTTSGGNSGNGTVKFCDHVTLSCDVGTTLNVVDTLLAGSITANGTVNYSNVCKSTLFFFASSFITGAANLLQSSQGNVIHSRRVAVDTSIAAGDYYIGVTDTSSPRTMTLPIASTLLDQSFIIKDESLAAATNNITINVSGGALIDGSATKLINTNGGSLTFIFDGTNYFIF